MELSEQAGIEEETGSLIYDYLASFDNLYGMISLGEALDIIRDQNPDLNISDQQFYRFVEAMSWQFYGKPEGDDPDWQNPERIALVADSLKADTALYRKTEEFRGSHPEIDYYEPEKRELLRYADEGYFEKTKQYDEMLDLLKYDLRLDEPDRAAEDLRMVAFRSENGKAQEAVDRLINANYLQGFLLQEQVKRFIEAYYYLYDHTRKHLYKGHTPAEIGKNVIGVEDITVTMLNIHAQRKMGQKPGRNDPCPCGSGKKFKKCCMGKGIYD